MNDGVFFCLVVVIVPLVTGFGLGGWFERRKIKHGMPGALMPGFLRRWLEDERWK